MDLTVLSRTGGGVSDGADVSCRVRKHPRIRKAVKWGGLVLGLAALSVWVVSAWLSVRWTGDLSGSNQVFVTAGQGILGLGYGAPPKLWHTYFGWESWKVEDPFLWWYWDYMSLPHFGLVRLPIWVLALPMFLVSTAAWGLDRRACILAANEFCVRCGYDRAGIAALKPCPECGEGPRRRRAGDTP